MKKTVLLFAVVVGLCWSVGCKNEHADKIKRIDSLYAELEAIEDTMQTIRISEINALIDENDKLVNKVNEEYPDTMSKEAMFFFSDYKRYRKSLVQLRENYTFQLEQVGFSKTQLENLKEDVQNGLVVGEAFNNYFKSEQEAVARNAETARNLKTWYTGTFDRYNELKKGLEDNLQEIKEG